jgi:hypothetical protein
VLGTKTFSVTAMPPAAASPILVQGYIDAAPIALI